MVNSKNYYEIRTLNKIHCESQCKFSFFFPFRFDSYSKIEIETRCVQDHSEAYKRVKSNKYFVASYQQINVQIVQINKFLLIKTWFILVDGMVPWRTTGRYPQTCVESQWSSNLGERGEKNNGLRPEISLFHKARHQLDVPIRSRNEEWNIFPFRKRTSSSSNSSCYPRESLFIVRNERAAAVQYWLKSKMVNDTFGVALTLEQESKGNQGEKVKIDLRCPSIINFSMTSQAPVVM